MLSPFHLAFPVNDLVAAEQFYHGILGCPIGRRSDSWIDFDFHGHQIVSHLAKNASAALTNPVDGEDVPVRHFGLVLTKPVWDEISDTLKSADVPFLIAPTIRFENQPGEQGTFFVKDPAGNALEFKYFVHGILVSPKLKFMIRQVINFYL